MKKTLAALAVLGAFAGTSLAADVTLYGRLDTGIAYTHTDIDDVKTNTTELKTGFNTGSRLGVKGSEDLGNGWNVGFILESQFNSDDGALRNGGILWDREATIAVSNKSFGKLTMGRMGSIRGATSSAGWTGAYSPFSTGWGDHVIGTGKTAGNGGLRLNNTVMYVTPKFGGVEVAAQYSFANTAEGTTVDKDNRYMALAARYVNGPLNVGAVVDTTNLSQATDGTKDDPMAVSFGAAYDFGVAKIYGMASYFMDSAAVSPVTPSTNFNASAKGYDGFGVHLGTSAPVLGGTAMFGVSYYDAESADETADGKCDVTWWNLAAAYKYDLSKRTYTYVGAGYTQEEIKFESDKIKDSAAQVGFGLVHMF